MRRIGGGGYAEVFAIDDTQCVKIARAQHVRDGSDNADGFVDVTGGVAESVLQPHEVLLAQGKQLSQPRAGWITCLDIGRTRAPDGEERASLRLPLLPGRPLQKGDHPRLILQIARAVAEVPHLDLKPSNAMVQGETVTLIDPGLADGPNLVTTPAWNPFLKPNDIASLGLLLRFVLSGQTPPTQRAERGEFSASIKEQLNGERILGRSAMSRLIGLQNDRTFGDYAATIWRSLGLRIDDKSVLHREEPFASVTQFTAALERVCK